jgi:hypothetical protein
MSDQKTYELTGGPEGTGTIQRPEGMDERQKLKYDEAIRRRQKPGIYARFDSLKRQAQDEYAKKIGKPRPTYFPSQQEDEGKAAFRQFFEDADKQPPVSGDYEPTEQDLDDEFEEFTDPGSKSLHTWAQFGRSIHDDIETEETSPQFIEDRRDRLREALLEHSPSEAELAEERERRKNMKFEDSLLGDFALPQGEG